MKDIKRTEEQIQLVIDSDDELSRLFSIVESVPGVGRISATEIVITTNEFKNIHDARKYACYAGVALSILPALAYAEKHEYQKSKSTSQNKTSHGFFSSLNAL